MRKYRLPLLLREFRFLEGLKGENDHPINPADATKIQIERLDRRVLDQCGHLEETRTSNYWEDTESFTLYWGVWGDEVILFDHTEEKMIEGNHSSKTADIIGEQLLGKTRPDFIIRVESSYDYNNGRTSVWTIYKTDNFDLLAYHQQKIDLAAAQIKAEMVAARKGDQK